MNRLYKIAVVATLFILAATVSAQAQVYYGVKAGTNIGNFSLLDAKDIDPMKSEYGYQAGVVLGAKVPLLGIGVEAEALWVNNKMSFAAGNDVISNSIEIPVMATIPILPVIPIKVKVGPSFMLYNDAKEIMADGSEKALDPVKSSLGYTLGLGAKIWKITLDVRYNGQFKAQSIQGLNNVPSKYDIRANTFSASLGYIF